MSPAEPRTASAAELGREAIRLLGQAIEKRPAELKQDVDRAENAVVRLRDQLIDELRRERDEAKVPRCRSALDRVNAALSLVAGVEYPAAGIQRSDLEQARDALRQLLDEGRL